MTPVSEGSGNNVNDNANHGSGALIKTSGPSILLNIRDLNLKG
jgi:hypothetical protein